MNIQNLIPVIIQDYQTNEVYMLGYMNQGAYDLTQKTGFVHFWSRSRNELWRKGETSGNTLEVIEMLKDCDEDTLLIKVKLNGTHVCHTGNKTCFNKISNK